MNQTNSSPFPLRHWTPYEQTQLARHGFSQLQVAETDQRPVEYFTERVEFAGWEFKVTPAVLIPRVETEELIPLVWSDIREYFFGGSDLTIVDVATGSGAIGLTLWRLLAESHQQLVNPKICLTDISAAALAVTQENWQALAAKYRNELVQLAPPQFLNSDLLTLWPKDQPIHCLIANLPYIPTARLATLDPSVRDFEPHLALDGGPDGLVLVDQLLDQAQTLLAPNGVIWLEIDETHTLAQLTALRPEYSYQFFTDTLDKSRFVRAILKV